MLVPLYGFVEGDSMGLLVLAHDNWTVEKVASRLRASASVRVTCTGDAALLHRGVRLDPRRTVAQAGLKALDRIDLRRGDV